MIVYPLVLFTLGDSIAQVPTVPGAEYTMSENRVHGTLNVNKLHCEMPDNKIHYTTRDEN